MARIVGVNLPADARIGYALTLIYGVGFANGEAILKAAQIDAGRKVKDIAEEELKKIQTTLEKQYAVEGDLKEKISENIKRLKSIGSYRGARHSRNLPVRGQRSKSNARTKRGKRKTVGALKKEDSVKMSAPAPAAKK